MSKYRVVIDTKGCPKCKAGRNWMVIRPNGVGYGISYGCKEEADELAFMLNEAAHDAEQPAKEER